MTLIQSTPIHLYGYLFIPYGSRTRGTDIKDSDLDILLICEKEMFLKGYPYLLEYIHTQQIQDIIHQYFEHKFKMKIQIDITPCSLYDSINTPLGKFNRYQIYYPHSTQTFLTMPEYVNQYINIMNKQYKGTFSVITKSVKYLFHYILHSDYPSVCIERYLINLFYLFKEKDDAFFFYQKVLL